MAESSRQDASLKTQSVGDNSPSDALATTNDTTDIGGAVGVDTRRDVELSGLTGENGIDGKISSFSKLDDQLLEDSAARSDTDTSHGGSVAGDSKSAETKSFKRFSVSKPVSFAKYSVPKVITTNAPPKTTSDKVTPSTTTTPPSQLLGRPRLVAKTTSSLQQKTPSYKHVTPDPMQVWNKNRATPQPSTKHLTDEELKQQYGIHLTSRLQSDGEGKESKWADIDDDEDDWAPETIEWNDGTKTTVNAADPPTSKQTTTSSLPEDVQSVGTPPKIVPQYSSSIGPNATVLKLGANAERQQAQRALSQQSKGSSDKTPLFGSKTAPAPPPSKSPWAPLPAIDKVSPIAIHPQPVMSPSARPILPGSQPSRSDLNAPSPAKEISADDFNRSWRGSPSSQTRELFVPNSGRYETVPDGRRRMSRNEQNFRAPAVLQRPGQSDSRAPAEPSAAFQTRRASIDQGRRRTSSSISGGSGQFARRMSLKSSEVSPLVVEAPQPELQDESSAQAPVPAAYQARGGEQPAEDVATVDEPDLEAQRAQQKALMREKIEMARRRKEEEEKRFEAEKAERIRLKLASLGPDPKLTKTKGDEAAKTESPTGSPAPQAALPVQSPPKPPQPLPTGEPQQYGMMRVHPMDSVKKFSPPSMQDAEPVKPQPEAQDIPAQSRKLAVPTVNGVRHTGDVPRPSSEEATAGAETAPKLNKAAAPYGADARVSWNMRHDHRSPPTGNLWGLTNKSLGNGTFDQSLAGYAPQDLSRSSSTGQGWMNNGRTPTVGQSPQLQQVNQHVPETRSHLLQSMTSPDQQPLSLNSEIDSALPVNRPAPIGPPQQQPAPSQNSNGYNPSPPTGVAAWNNFHGIAREEERAESERFRQEYDERREQEKRTGVRQQSQYNFNETFKQVQLGDQVGQRHLANAAPPGHPPSSMFGAVGSLPPAEFPARIVNGQGGRGSRFFPLQMNGIPPQERRAVTYSHPEVPRTPSPPPAEELASLHPAFDGHYQRPVVHFPREKAVVRLPPAAPIEVTPPQPAPVEETTPRKPSPPMTWAARVSMPAPAPVPQVRAVSTPLAQNPSWQERFNGLLGKRQAQNGQAIFPAQALQPAAVATVTKVPLDVAPTIVAASVSLPQVIEIEVVKSGKLTTKDVEDEEDLFEDREAGSLPIIHLPRDVSIMPLARNTLSREYSIPPESSTVHMFMVNNWSERHAPSKPQYAIIRVPGSIKSIKKDLPSKPTSGNSLSRSRNSSGQFASKHSSRHNKPTSKNRVASKAH